MAIIIGVWAFFGTKTQIENYEGDNPSNIALNPQAPAPELLPPVQTTPPVYFETGVIWDRTGTEALAPFEVLTRSGRSYYLKLVKAESGEDAIGILIRGGESLDVSIPLGRFYLKWCSGDTWYGEELRFGGTETCSKSNDILEFRRNGSYVEGNTITLYAVNDGNMNLQYLNPNKF